MDEKKNAVFTLCIFSAIILIFIVADIFTGNRLYSELENRMLAEKPEFSKKSFLEGKFSKKYEEYLTDQFAGRDKLVALKTRMDIILGKKEINGAYIGKDGYLFEVHLPADYAEEVEDEKTELLGRLVDKYDAHVMLVPTADNIITDKMPDNAVYYDETGLLEKVRERVGEENYIDVYSWLLAHNDEDIYYKTDHHWTMLGAYYGFQAWRQGTEKIFYPYRVEKMATVSNSFQGSLHSRIPIVDETDEIMIFPQTLNRKVGITYDFTKKTESLYEESYLDTKNKYGYFLDDNHALVEIDTDYHNARTLFIIKDSYANCMVPLLLPYYEKIYVLDLRYYNGRLSDFIDDRMTSTGMDVLVLYNCAHFMDDFMYY